MADEIDATEYPWESVEFLKSLCEDETPNNERVLRHLISRASEKCSVETLKELAKTLATIRQRQA